MQEASILMLQNKYICLLNDTDASEIRLLQQNEYHTVPYFHQLSQNMTADCLLIYVFLAVTLFYLFLSIFTCQVCNK